MQELTFEQVEVVSGGFVTTLGSPLGGLSGPFVIDNYTIQNQQDGGSREINFGENTAGSGFVGSTAHKYATVAAAGATVTATAALLKCTATGPAYFFCVAGAAVGGAVGGVAGQALVDYFSP